ncbi:MAG: DUF1592 domain-containing protein [Armatimonadota bacterium]
MRPVHRCALTVVPSLLLPWIAAAVPQDAPGAVQFDKEIRPAVTTYCQPCHGADSASGGIRFDRFPDSASVARDTALWRKALRAVRERTMPPQGARRLPTGLATRIVEPLGQLVEHFDSRQAPRDPGRVVPRRLNRTEYNNTVRDLLGVDTRPADRFPADGGGGGGFDNNADTLFLPPVLMEKYLEAAGELLAAAPEARIMPVSPGGKLTARSAAAQNLRRFAARAYRRPVRTDEIARLLAVYDRARSARIDHRSATRLALKAVLVSPNFLFRAETDPGNGGAVALGDYELASRLSYFLWCSMPDDRLFALAAAGKLREPDTLAAQVRRMLADPKCVDFADAFAGQWLRTREILETAQPDTGKFPEFTPTLRRAMFDETVAFFLSVVRDNAPAITLLDADYTFLNRELARHYGLPPVEGDALRRVRLPDSRRGGVLAQGAVLTLTSYPQRTSPVLRGKWILSEILGAPPPPPPPVVATLPPDDRPKEGQTLRQRLEAHRAKPECRSCHERIDPLGFALENYDAIGRWREDIGGVKVDAVGTLSTGERFEGPVELKRILRAREADVARNIVERMLAYALGRGLEPADLPSVRKIVSDAAPGGYRTGDLITGIVRSLPFRYRKGEEAKAALATKETP